MKTADEVWNWVEEADVPVLTETLVMILAYDGKVPPPGLAEEVWDQFIEEYGKRQAVRLLAGWCHEVLDTRPREMT